MKLRKLFIKLMLMILASQTVTALVLPKGAELVNQAALQTASNITFLVAFLAGIVAFTSPCGFLLLPAFFSFWFNEKNAVKNTALFGLGLMIAYLALGAIAFVFGDIFAPVRDYFITTAGIVLILFGVMAFLGKGFSIMKFSIRQPKNNIEMVVMGFFLGIGWTPCISPIVSGMFLLASISESMVKAMLFMVVFAIGITSPLLLLAFLSDKYNWSVKWLSGKAVKIGNITTHSYNIVSGTILIAIGLIMLLTRGTIIIQDWLIAIWSMDLYNLLNEKLVTANWLSSTTANIIGIIIGLAIIFLSVRYIRNRDA